MMVRVGETETQEEQARTGAVVLVVAVAVAIQLMMTNDAGARQYWLLHHGSVERQVFPRAAGATRLLDR